MTAGTTARHHAVLVILALLGAAAWIMRSTGFDPLQLIQVSR